MLTQILNQYSLPYSLNKILSFVQPINWEKVVNYKFQILILFMLMRSESVIRDCMGQREMIKFKSL